MSPDSSNHFAHIPKPPKLAEKLLAFVLHQEDKEVVLGDFEEEYFLVAGRFGVKQAKLRYWFELFKSIPTLCFLNYKKSIRGHTMSKNKKSALLGAALVLPALLLVVGGVAQSGLGITKINDMLNFDLVLFHPVVIVGGLLLAFVLNLFPIVRIDYQDGVLISTLTIRDRLLNVGLISGIGLLAATIFLYLLAENYQVFQLIF